MTNKRRIDGSGDSVVGRRAILGGTVVGGVALASGFIGPLAGSVIGQESMPVGPAQPVKTGRIRRVATGQNSHGKSYIASDEVVAIEDGWSTASKQPLGATPDGERRSDFEQATGETRFWITAMEPHADPKPDLVNRIGFHRTPGVAYIYILSGEVMFLVDEGEVRLRPGDLLVERGTDHSWRNEGPEPVGLLIVMANAA